MLEPAILHNCEPQNLCVAQDGAPIPCLSALSACALLVRLVCTEAGIPLHVGTLLFFLRDSFCS